MRAPRRSTGKRPNATTGAGYKTASKRMLPPGMDIPKSTTTRGGKPIKAGGGRSLKDAIERFRKGRKAGKARSTGTPKAPTKAKRPTRLTPVRGTPPTTRGPRRPSGVSRPGTRRPTNRPPRSVRSGGTRRRFSFRGMGRR